MTTYLNRIHELNPNSWIGGAVSLQLKERSFRFRVGDGSWNTKLGATHFSQKKGKTPVLDREEARALIAAIDTGSLTGLRDRALIGVMIYTFARTKIVSKEAKPGHWVGASGDWR